MQNFDLTVELKKTHRIFGILGEVFSFGNFAWSACFFPTSCYHPPMYYFLFQPVAGPFPWKNSKTIKKIYFHNATVTLLGLFLSAPNILAKFYVLDADNSWQEEIHDKTKKNFFSYFLLCKTFQKINCLGFIRVPPTQAMPSHSTQCT